MTWRKLKVKLQSYFLAILVLLALGNFSLKCLHIEDWNKSTPNWNNRSLCDYKEKTMAKSENQEIKITIGDKVLTATLNDSKTSHDFISLLPLTLILEDYAGTEKISDLPKRLSTEDAPTGSDPSVGDITYYTPWGNLAIFYKDFGYASGLVILGKIDSGIEAFDMSDSVKVKIELIEY